MKFQALLFLKLFFFQVSMLFSQQAKTPIEQIAHWALELLDEQKDADEKLNDLDLIQKSLCALDFSKEELQDFKNSLPMLQIAISPDSVFAVITGEARIQQDHYQYFGGIYHFQSQSWHCFSPANDEARSQKFDPSQWPGGICYNVLRNNHGKLITYTLLSYRWIDYFRREKRMDNMTLQNGVFLLGQPIIHVGKSDPLHSFALEYAAEAPVFFNFDEMEVKLVFDHLIPFRGLYEGQGTVYVPDGSYSAFEWRRGAWHLIEKLPTQVRDTPPLEQPVLDKRKQKDIFGRNRPGSMR